MDETTSMLRALSAEQGSRGTFGAIGEIGARRGRLLVTMAGLARRDEGIVAVDPFDPGGPGADALASDALAEFRAHLAHHLAEPDLVAIVASDSVDLTGRDLVDAADGQLRLLSIGGGRSASVIRHDLEIAASALLPGGIVVLDGYLSPTTPEVAAAAVRFLVEPRGPALVPFATGGERLWLTGSEADASAYRHRLQGLDDAQIDSARMLGHEMTRVEGA